MTRLPLALRLALRELRGGLKGFRIFLASLALGVAAIAAVGTLSASIVAGLERNARTLMGGDVEISQTARDLAPAVQDYLRANSASVSLSREARAMARPAEGGNRVLVELKAVDAVYPLYGALVLRPAMNSADALGRRDGRFGAVAEETLLNRLGAAVGDVLQAGDQTFEVRAVIDSEPDRVANAFSLGPRLMVSSAGFEATGLGVEGSLTRYKYRVRLAPAVESAAWRADLHAAFPEGLWRVRDATAAQPSIARFIDRLGVFLTLAGVTALVLGGIGVGNAVGAYLGARHETIATLKCLGAPSGLIFRVYLVQIGLLALAGTGIGLLIGALAPVLLTSVLAGILPVSPESGIQVLPLVRAAAFGLLTAFAFTVWPLSRARDVPAAGLFRALVAPARRWPRPMDTAVMLAAALALAGLAVFGTGVPFIAQWFVLGAVGLLIVFRIAAALIIDAMRHLGRPHHTGLRLALANLSRPGAPTASVVVSLGAGLTVLVATALVQANISAQVRERIPAVAPSFFFIDIQSPQVAAFEETVRGADGYVALERVPNLRGRLVAVNGVRVDRAAIGPDMAWVRRHEFGFTYANARPDRAVITQGTWWPGNFSGAPAISLDEDMARGLGLALGDTLTFNILGREVTAQIRNLRRIDWSDFGINYYVVFAPGTLENAPQTHLATATFTPEAEETAYRTITDKFANVSAVRVKDVIEAASRILGQIAAAAAGTAGITILAGVLVLAGAVAAGHRRRVYDAVILKVLGATRRDVLRAYMLEYLVLGGMTAILAVFAGTLGAWLVVTQAMQADWSFVTLPALGTALAGIALTVVFGYAGTWIALGQKAAPVLRTQ